MIKGSCNGLKTNRKAIIEQLKKNIHFHPLIWALYITSLLSSLSHNLSVPLHYTSLHHTALHCTTLLVLYIYIVFVTKRINLTKLNYTATHTYTTQHNATYTTVHCTTSLFCSSQLKYICYIQFYPTLLYSALLYFSFSSRFLPLFSFFSFPRLPFSSLFFSSQFCSALVCSSFFVLFRSCSTLTYTLV